MYIDIHTHLYHQDFSIDLDQVVDRARQAGLKIILTNGVDPKTNRISLEQSKKYDIVKAALGVFPVEALNFKITESGNLAEIKDKKEIIDLDKEIDYIKKNQKKITAIGEVGLDFYWVKDKNKEQIENLFKFIKLSEEIKKPLVLHTRNAEKEVLECLESSKVKHALLHCFSGNFKLVKKAVDMDLHFSIPTNVIYSQHFQQLVKEVNINRLFIETDAPYLGPFKGERNEPKNVVVAYNKLAEIKKFDQIETRNTIYMNYQKLFL